MHPKGRGPEFANEKRGPAERAVTGIRIGRLAVSAYVPFRLGALHLSAYMARACEIVPATLDVAARNRGGRSP